MDTTTLSVLSLSLGLGLLIGLQRQRAGSRLGGIRTFPLIALLGAICGLLAGEWGALVVVAGFVAVTSMTVLSNLRRSGSEAADAGQTTEAAALLTYALGAFIATGNYAAATVVGGLTAVLLQFKEPLHDFAGGMSERDVRAVMRFAIISLIILPTLPDQAYGPYEVLNPREIWWMVVLIVGISLSGYVSYKLIRGRTGVVLSGIFGGLISSTATSVAYARRVKDDARAAPVATLVIAIAWTVSLARVLIEVAVVAPAALPQVAPPLGILLALMMAGALATRAFAETRTGAMPEHGNPAELKSAFIFGALYALVIFASAAARDYFGDQALFAVAVVSGFVDVDAITLSTSQLAAGGRLPAADAARIIVLAVLANLCFKAATVWVLGSARLFMRLAPLLLITLAGGILILMFWPVTPG